MTDSGLKLECEVKEALDLTVGAIERQGLQAVCSFELRDALDTGGHVCPCPYHGTTKCTCNYVVLSAYGPGSVGDSDLVGRVVIHSCGPSTWLNVPALESPGGAVERAPDSRLLRALAELLLACSCATGVEA